MNVCVSLCVNACVSTGDCGGQTRVSAPRGAGVPGSWEPSDVGTGDQTRVLCQKQRVLIRADSPVLRFLSFYKELDPLPLM